MLNYETYSKNNSLYNTPPSFSIYVTKLVIEWLKEQGGVSAIEEQNRMKSSLLYHFLDESKLFTSPVDHYVSITYEHSVYNTVRRIK